MIIMTDNIPSANIKNSMLVLLSCNVTAYVVRDWTLDKTTQAEDTEQEDVTHEPVVSTDVVKPGEPKLTTKDDNADIPLVEDE